MINDELWYAGERLSRPVSEEEIQDRLIFLIMEHGETMREEAIDIIQSGRSLVGIVILTESNSTLTDRERL